MAGGAREGGRLISGGWQADFERVAGEDGRVIMRLQADVEEVAGGF